MPAFGGLSPFPLRFGGGKSRVKVVLDSLLSQRGNGYDTSRDSYVYAEALGHARAVAAAWAANRRLRHVWDPSKLTGSMLARWERILGIVPPTEDSDAARRQRIAIRFERVGFGALSGELSGRLTDAVGDVFVTLEWVPYASALIRVPDGSYPWGSVSAGAPWASTTAHLLVLLQRPSGYTEGDFFDAAATVADIVDAALPAWATFDWYREPDSGGTATPGGPSLAGFYLDDEHNLDANIFDV